MKIIIMSLFTVALLTFPVWYSANLYTNGVNTIKINDDVSSSYTYLKDGDNNEHNYGARYTLTNNTSEAKNVHWIFTAHENVRSSTGEFSGVQYLIGYGQADIVTFIQIDRSKEWSVGSPTLTW